MGPHENLLRVYRELADWYEKQRQPQMRDRFLMLAADAALAAGRPDEAERLRLRLLKVNPHHMVKPYASFAEALKAPDVLTYVKDLRVNYPADVAEDLLRTLQGEQKHPPAGVPVTAPVMDLDASRTAALPKAEEGETFFDSKEEDLARTAAPVNAPRPRPPARPEPPQTIPLQPDPVRPAARPAPPRPLPPPAPRAAPLAPDARSAPMRPPEEPAAGGSWFAVLLFLLVLASGLALTGFIFLRPYLQLP